MISKLAISVLAAGLLSTAVLAQTSAPVVKNPLLGVWRMNLEQSVFEPGPAPVNAPYRVYIDLGEKGIANLAIGFDPQGVPGMAISVSHYDGAAVPNYDPVRLIELVASGDTSPIMQTYRMVDPSTLEITNIGENGEVVLTARRTIAADGRSFSETLTQTSAQGETQQIEAVYDMVCGEGAIYTC